MDFLLIPPKVSVENGVVTVSRIYSENLREDIENSIWSKRPYRTMFHRKDTFSISFHEFFALEFYFILEKILNHPETFTSLTRIRQIQYLLLKNTWMANIDKPHPDIVDFKKLNLFKYVPENYQMEFLEKYNKTVPAYGLKGMLLAAEPGTGKTFNTTALAECIGADIIYIVSPGVAVDSVWRKSIASKDSFFKKPKTFWSTRENTTYAGQRYVACNYEALPALREFAYKHKTKKTVIILDESHNLNEMSAIRTNDFLALCQETNAQMLYASGTPIKALAYEAIPYFKAIDPLFTPEVEEIFKILYKGNAGAHTELLKRRLNITSHRVSDQVLNLPEAIVEEIRISTPNAKNFTLSAVLKDMKAYASVREKELIAQIPACHQNMKTLVELAKSNIKASGDMAVYRDCEIDAPGYWQDVTTLNSVKNGNYRPVVPEMARCKEFEKRYVLPNLQGKDKKEFKNCAAIVKYYILKVRGECLGRVLGQKQIEAYSELARHTPYSKIFEAGDKKTLVFTTFKEVVNAVYNDLKSKGYKPLRVYGEYIKDLTSIVDDFFTKPELDPLIATYASLSTAVPLIAADKIIIINPAYRDYIMKQTIARVRRKGANTQTRVFKIMLDTGEEPNICARADQIHQWSKQQANEVLNIAEPDIEIDNDISPDILEESQLPDLKINDPVIEKLF